MLVQTKTEQLNIFRNLVLTKKELAEHIAAVLPTSQRTAYRLISGERRFINSYEYECVITKVNERIEQLQKAV
jgi:hypothetical protein